jgi:alcohol dehydrogenase (cytochrome c)
MDRMLIAYDDRDGRTLWETRLNDMPNSGIISYGVGNVQYVAVVVGSGGLHTSSFKRLVPEIKNPDSRSSAIHVFRLPSGLARKE